MSHPNDTLGCLARLLEYPDASTGALALAVAPRLAEAHPELSTATLELGAWLGSVTRGQAEEAYTVMFDLTPVSSLHLGYHLFGEDYNRGELLANLVFELRRAGVERGTELPDFLPTLMRLLARLDEEEDRRLLLDHLITPGMEKVNTELAKSESPWAVVLRFLGPALRAEARLSATPVAMSAPTVVTSHEESFHA